MKHFRDVMRHELDTFIQFLRYPEKWPKNYAQGWNDCLEEVYKLLEVGEETSRNGNEESKTWHQGSG